MGDSLYIGSCSGSFYALDRHRGQLIWSYDASFDSSTPNFHGNTLFAGDLVIVGTDGQDQGFLYAFDHATGSLEWLQEAPGGFPSDVKTRESRAYAVASTGEVRCMDVNTGEELWSLEGIEEERLLKTAVLVVGDRVVVSLPTGVVLSLDADSGEQVWKTRMPGKLNTSLVSIGNEIYIGDVEGRIHRLSSKDGKVLGAFEGDSPVYGALLWADDCLIALWGMDTLACLDPALGTVRWSRKTTSGWSSFQPLIRNGRVVVGTEDGEIHAFDLADGTTVWTHRLKGEIKGLGTHEGVLYVGTVQGRVYALRIPEGDPPRSSGP